MALRTGSGIDIVVWSDAGKDGGRRREVPRAWAYARGEARPRACQRILVTAVALWTLTACTAGDGAGGGAGAAASSRTAVPAGPADLCTEIGSELLGRLVPGGEPAAEADDFTGFNEATCAAGSPTTAQSGTKRSLWAELNRYGQDQSGRTPDEICRQALDGYRIRDAADWQHPSASEVPLRLGDVTQAQVRAIRWSAEAEILLCRSADFVRVVFRADGIDRAAAADAAETVARRMLDVFRR